MKKKFFVLSLATFTLLSSAGVSGIVSAKQVETTKNVVQNVNVNQKSMMVDGVEVIFVSANNKPITEEQKNVARNIVSKEISFGAKAIPDNYEDGYQIGVDRTKYFNWNDYSFIKNTLIALAGGIINTLGGILTPGARLLSSAVAGAAATEVFKIGVAKTKTIWWEYYSNYYKRYSRVIYQTVYKGNSNTPEKVYVSDPMFMSGNYVSTY